MEGPRNPANVMDLKFPKLQAGCKNSVTNKACHEISKTVPFQKHMQNRRSTAELLYVVFRSRCYVK